MSYYEKWLRRLETHVVEDRPGDARGDRERHAGDRLDASATPPVHAGDVRALAQPRRRLESRAAPSRPRFKVGQRVRARNINPTGHTRLPRYARGKVGVIERDHGVYVFPDTNAHCSGREAAARLLGAVRGARAVGRAGLAARLVYIDLWDDYLERA